ncbi:MAG TPA: YibE/F family protein, partial [Candidatus Limnocylindrales bacterium]
LYRRTMNVGIAHLAATVNTLVFAYLGAALPLLVLLALQVETFTLTVNEEIIAVEVVRTLVGSIGILLAVPATTAIATWLAPRPVIARRRVAPVLD